VDALHTENVSTLKVPNPLNLLEPQQGKCHLNCLRQGGPSSTIRTKVRSLSLYSSWCISHTQYPTPSVSRKCRTSILANPGGDIRYLILMKTYQYSRSTKKRSSDHYGSVGQPIETLSPNGQLDRLCQAVYWASPQKHMMLAGIRLQLQLELARGPLLQSTRRKQLSTTILS
jgi:hypothetical protein